MAVADPAKFHLINGHVASVEHGIFTVGSLIGTTTFFENIPLGSREICIKPFFHSWPRFVAVLAKISGAEILHFRSWMDGVVFGTGTQKGRGPRVTPNKRDKSHAPILGANLGRGDNS